MKLIFYIFLAILIVVLQLTVLPRLTILAVTPNLILAVALSLAISQKKTEVRWFIFGWAVFFDLLTGRPFGIFTLNLFLVFILINWIANYILKQNELIAILSLCGLGVVFFDFGLVVWQKVALIFLPNLRATSFLWRDFFSYLPVSIVYNTLICFVVFFFMKRFRFFSY